MKTELVNTAGAPDGTAARPEARHTAEPWKVNGAAPFSVWSGDTQVATCLWCAQEDDAEYADVCAPEHEAHANALLIAAAPELLAALIAVLPYLPPAHAKMSMVSGPAQLDAANAVRSAIAKAKGLL